ncbi:MAG: hypothetical protein ACR2OU_03570, partial [Thermomicrobiales bacterium]
TLVHVVGGHAIAIQGAAIENAGLAMAEHAAEAIGASIVSVELAMLKGELVVWDLHPVGDFRHAQVLGRQSIPEAIAELAVNGTRATNTHSTQKFLSGAVSRSAWEAEARHGVALTA